MALSIGLALSLGVAVFGRRAGLDRDRAFYATVVIVVASYYVLFAVLGGSTTALVAELAVAAVFSVAAVVGFRSTPWIIVGALAAHGMFDAVHGHLFENPGVPGWWPAFCGAYDVGASAWLAHLTATDVDVFRAVGGTRKRWFGAAAHPGFQAADRL